MEKRGIRKREKERGEERNEERKEEGGRERGKECRTVTPVIPATKTKDLGRVKDLLSLSKFSKCQFIHFIMYGHLK